MRNYLLSLLALFIVLAMTMLGNEALCADKNNAAKEETPKETSTQKSKESTKMAKVTGIGGVFFRAKKDQKALSDWYTKNLGMPLESWGGAILRWSDDKAEGGGVTVWQATEKDSDLYKPSESEFMINYRIDNMDLMLEQLKNNGVKIFKGPESHENGRFLWVLDPDGNKVELWEPKIWDEKNKKP